MHVLARIHTIKAFGLMYKHIYVYMQHMRRASRNNIYIYIQENIENKEDLLALNLSFQG